MLNQNTYNWKYEPVVAANAYLRIHPDAIKKAAPPPPVAAADAALQQRQEQARKEAEDAMLQMATTTWNDIKNELDGHLEEYEVEILKKVTPLAMWRKGLKTKNLKVATDNETASALNEMSLLNALLQKFGITLQVEYLK